MNFLNILRKKIQSKEGKVLIENFISLSLLQVVGYILPLITLPYIAKTIGVENFGSIAFATAVIVFFQTFVDYGFNYTGIRDISRVKDDKNKVSKILSQVIYARIFLMILGALILICLIVFIPIFSANKLVLLCTYSLLPGYVLYPEWFFQAIEKMKYSAILSTVVKLIFTIAIFFFVKSESDFYLIPILNSFGYLFSGFIAFYIIYQEGFKLKKVAIREIIYALLKSTNMFITLILPNLYSNISPILLNSYWGKAATGIFDGGNKFTLISQQATNVLSRTFYPFLARRMDKHKFYVKVSFTISLIISLFLFFAAPFLVNLFYTNEFKEATIVIRIMSITPIFIFLINTYGTNYLVLKNHERILRNIVIVTSLIGFVLAFILIREYSFIGAAVSIVLSRALNGILTWYYAIKIKNNNK